MFSRMSAIRPETYIAAGQIGLGLCLLGCLVIIPDYLFRFNQGGISNYGTEARTQYLFVLGFASVTLGTLLAAFSFKSRLRVSLIVLALLYALVMLSTFSYKLDDSLKQLHVQTAVALFVGMLFFALWLRVVAVKDAATRRAFLVLCAGIIANGLTLIGVLHIIFVAEVVSGAAFGYMLVHGVAVLRKPLRTSSKRLLG